MKQSVIVNEEKIHLKKDRFGWRVIHPVKNDDGSWNWKNFLVGGSYWNLLKVGAIVGIILFMCWAYKHDMQMCEHLLECGAKCIDPLYYDPTGVSILNLTLGGG